MTKEPEQRRPQACTLEGAAGEAGPQERLWALSLNATEARRIRLQGLYSGPLYSGQLCQLPHIPASQFALWEKLPGPSSYSRVWEVLRLPG